jgi:DNA-binding transcriptional ArsR family regulator
MPDSLELRDPRALRALAHPTRVRLLALLREHGPGTSTSLARAMSASTGETSYHLRVLARYGLIQPAEGYRGARERWWRAAARHFHLPEDAPAGSPVRTAARVLRDEILRRDARILASFLAGEDQDGRPRAVLFSNEVIHVTPAELREVGERISAALQPFVRGDVADRPEGAERVFVAIHAVPWTEL